MRNYHSIRIREEITLRDFLIEMTRGKPDTMGTFTILYTDNNFARKLFEIDYRFSKVERPFELDDIMHIPVKYAFVTHDVLTICENYIVELRD